MRYLLLALLRAGPARPQMNALPPVGLSNAILALQRRPHGSLIRGGHTATAEQAPTNRSQP